MIDNKISTLVFGYHLKLCVDVDKHHKFDGYLKEIIYRRIFKISILIVMNKILMEMHTKILLDCLMNNWNKRFTMERGVMWNI